MKVHYINILLFAVPLNILVNTHKKPYITPKIPTTRLLCECELYAPVNYDNDPQMKKVMQQFEDRTSQRFKEYDERMVEKRKQCKEQCDKEIQKIILKDKLEKQMAEQFATLQTDIQNDAIPTCICEKSIADKVEKGCLRCGGILGAAMPELGAIGGTVVYAAAIKAATKAGIAKSIEIMKDIFKLGEVSAIDLEQLITPANFKCPNALVAVVNNVNNMCYEGGAAEHSQFCFFAYNFTAKNKSAFFTKTISEKAGKAAADGLETYGTTFVAETSPNAFLTNPYIASSIAIIIIVAILLVIYLILRYRRRNKMKKKVQYIKLLKE